MLVAVPDTPLKPKNPAIIAMIKNITDHVNINPSPPEIHRTACLSIFVLFLLL